MERTAIASAVDAAIVPLVASLGAWGVESGHHLPDRGGAPVLWLCTRTDAQGRVLERQGWLLPQVQVMLTWFGVPYDVVRQVRVVLTSLESEARLLRDWAADW